MKNLHIVYVTYSLYRKYGLEYGLEIFDVSDEIYAGLHAFVRSSVFFSAMLNKNVMGDLRFIQAVVTDKEYTQLQKLWDKDAMSSDNPLKTRLKTKAKLFRGINTIFSQYMVTADDLLEFAEQTLGMDTTDDETFKYVLSSEFIKDNNVAWRKYMNDEIIDFYKENK